MTAWVAPSNVNVMHVRGGWGLGIKKEFRTVEELTDFCNRFAWTMEPELGDRAVLWEERKI